MMRVLPRPLRPYRHLPGLVLLAGLGLVILILPALPFPLGIVGPARYAYASYVPTDADGIFLSTHRGELELYAWYFPLNSFPGDAPAMHMGVVKSLFVTRPALDSPWKFSLINLKNQHRLPLRAVRLPNGRQMRLIPLHPIPPGRYVMLAPTEGMDGGYEWYYFSVTQQGGRT
jgi:hypothetical protein